jgi:hypothetical protein
MDIGRRTGFGLLFILFTKRNRGLSPSVFQLHSEFRISALLSILFTKRKPQLGLASKRSGDSASIHIPNSALRIPHFVHTFHSFQSSSVGQGHSPPPGPRLPFRILVADGGRCIEPIATEQVNDGLCFDGRGGVPNHAARSAAQSLFGR